MPLAFASGLMLSVAAPAWAGGPGPGDLDGSFSTDGKATIDTTETMADDFGNGMWIQANGKILVVGQATGTDSDVGLARFNADGTPDEDFGEGGTVLADYGGDENATSVIRVGPRIFVGGSTASDFLLAAFDAQGHKDLTFGGSDGFVTTDIDGADGITELGPQPDGTIVAGGFSTGTASDFSVVRYEADGDLDPTFSTDGIATTDFGGLSDFGEAIVLQPNGKIVQGGSTGGGVAGDGRFALVRYLANGKRDASYGSGGRVTTSIGPFSDDLLGLARQSDGKIVAAGEVFRSTGEEEDFGLVRYETDGSEDPSFGGGDGEVITVFPEGFSIARGVAVQASGKIVAAGVLLGPGVGDFVLARYKSDGSLNGSFGTGGLVHTDFDSGSDDGAKGVAIQADGRIVLAGTSNDGSGNDFAVARYLSA